MNKLIRYFDKITVKRAFIFMFAIWMLDIITTILGLTFKNNLIEGNPFANLFFSMGFKGWLFWIFIGGLCILGVSYIIEKVQGRVSKLVKFSWVVSFIPILTFFILEGYVILNNVWNILW